MSFWCFLLFVLVQSLETETIMATFQKAYEKLSQAFGGVPCEELGISDEVKEQVGPSLVFSFFGRMLFKLVVEFGISYIV